MSWSHVTISIYTNLDKVIIAPIGHFENKLNKICKPGYLITIILISEKNNDIWKENLFYEALAPE